MIYFSQLNIFLFYSVSLVSALDCGLRVGACLLLWCKAFSTLMILLFIINIINQIVLGFISAVLCRGKSCSASWHIL